LVEREYYYPRFTEEFISNIKDYVLELSDKDYKINIHEVLYFRWQDDKRYESISIDIDGELVKFNDELKQVLLTIKSYSEDSNFKVDIEITHEDEYITLEEFIEQYKGEEFGNGIAILIW
jgi:2'-5' RNA ligase